MNKNKIIKIITYSLVIIIPIGIIYFVSSRTNILNKNSNLPTSINQLQIDNSKIFYLNNNITNIKWENEVSNKKEAISFYEVEDLKNESMINNILLKYQIEPKNFEDIGSNNKIWRSEDKVILLNNTDNKLDISFENKTTTKRGFIQDQLINQAKKVIQDLINIPYLELNSIEYYIDDNLESEKGKMEESKIAKVGFIQKTPDNNVKIIPRNFSSNDTVTITIDSLLQTRYISAHSSIKNLLPSKSKQTISLDKDKVNIGLLHRITPFDISDEIKIERSNNTTFTAKNVEVAYTQLENKLLPIFLLTGDLYVNDQIIGTATYVTPSTNLESL